ncbi:PaaI family thioesterase [Methylopila henanensis]|uniref:PaaI family thioesterase n=1 Tax=Methylopila henanensis TaxID=873516 RepID=A0ABW4K0Z7_9HYPH
MTEMPRRPHDLTPRMTLDDVTAFLAAEFPQIPEDGGFVFEAVGYGSCRARLLVDERRLRPGGTVSGPSMMALADVGLYVALLGAIGPVKLAVTTNLSINFLRRPEPHDMIAECRFLKIGRTLAVGEAELFSRDAEPVAHVVATYSIPPKE